MLLFPLLFLPAISPAKVTYQELIFKNGTYDKNEAPYDIDGKMMPVYLNPTFVILVNVEEDQQLISFMAIINFTWVDSRLAYDPKQITNKYVIIPRTLIWMPWIYCYNCVEVTFLDKNTETEDAWVSPDGTVSAFMRARFDTVCTCDISAFPFDTQYCGLNFEGGFALFEQMNFFPRWQHDKIFTELPSGTWSITTRQMKITMGVTGLLGLTFLLSILVQEVPRSKNLPLIGKWLLIEMFVCIVAMSIISPLNKLKRRIDDKFEKSKRWQQMADVAAFLLVFGVNSLATLFMFLFPGDLKTAPKKPF